jgi:hypothetical protein
MDAVYHLGEILLLVQVCQFKNKTLDDVLETVRHIKIVTHLGQADMPNKVKEIVDIIRMTKIQLGCLDVEYETRHYEWL